MSGPSSPVESDSEQEHAYNHVYNDSDSDTESGEESIDDVSQTVEDLTDEAIMFLRFDSLDHAEKFYIAYGRKFGFFIRRRTSGKFHRQWVCCQEGFRDKSIDEAYNMRKRRERPITRFGCLAGFRVVLEEHSQQYKVTSFNNNHSHDLNVIMKSYLSAAEKFDLSFRTKIGLRPCQAIASLQELMHGAGPLMFHKKTAYNWLNKMSMEKLKEGDIKYAVETLAAMKEKDPQVYYEYTLDSTGTMNRLFFSDATSRVEYAEFGDVLVFDSTYKTNRYSYPLVLFSGASNHGKTCIFACAFLRTENVPSYEWLLTEFLKCMGNKKPLAILTDQDKAMRRSIKNLLPRSLHRICSWHLCRNLKKYIHDKEFLGRFCYMVDRKCSIAKWEKDWADLVRKYKVDNISWVVETYNIRARWAKAFFPGDFLAFTKTTQRAESTNSLVKANINCRMSITQFLERYRQTLRNLRQGYATLQLRSENETRFARSGPLFGFEQQALNVYTFHIFQKVLIEINAVVGVISESRVRDGEGNHCHYYREFLLKNKMTYHRVRVNESKTVFRCSCLKMESEWIPCRHIIASLQYLNFTGFPPCLLKRRWLKVSGCQIRKMSQDPHYPISVEEQRFGLLSRESLSMNHYASQTRKGFELSRAKLREVTENAVTEMNKSAKKRRKNNESRHPGNSQENDNPSNGYGSKNPKPKDPEKKKDKFCLEPTKKRTRGAEKGVQQCCRYCKGEGHKRTTCEKLKADLLKNSQLPGPDTSCSQNPTVNDKGTSNSPP